MFYYLTISGTTYEVSDEEHKQVLSEMVAGKTRHIFRNGESVLFSTISETISEDRWQERDKNILEEKGKYRCKYSSTHWKNEECNCRPRPSEATQEEIDVSKGLLAKAQRIMIERAEQKQLKENFTNLKDIIKP